MEAVTAVTGIFPSLTQGTRAAQRLQSIVGPEHINLLTPESTHEAVRAVPTTEDMPPVGAPLGATLGGALGVATAFMLPGVGLVTALGAAAAALLGAVGGIAGWKAGEAADHALSGGVPADELYVYEDALRQGRTVVMVQVHDPDKEPMVRTILELYGAESVDAARDRWWLGLRDAEAEHYEPEGGFADDERLYRHGFTAAIGRPGSNGNRRPEELDVWPLLDEREREVVRRGFERGLQYRDSGSGASAR
jgi:outer membrane lipoprotein SlyB